MLITDEDLNSVAEAVSRFTIDLYLRLCCEKHFLNNESHDQLSNTIICPLPIYVQLAHLLGMDYIDSSTKNNIRQILKMIFLTPEMYLGKDYPTIFEKILRDFSVFANVPLQGNSRKTTRIYEDFSSQLLCYPNKIHNEKNVLIADKFYYELMKMVNKEENQKLYAVKQQKTENHVIEYLKQFEMDEDIDISPFNNFQMNRYNVIDMMLINRTKLEISDTVNVPSNNTETMPFYISDEQYYDHVENRRNPDIQIEYIPHKQFDNIQLPYHYNEQMKCSSFILPSKINSDMNIFILLPDSYDGLSSLLSAFNFNFIKKEMKSCRLQPCNLRWPFIGIKFGFDVNKVVDLFQLSQSSLINLSSDLCTSTTNKLNFNYFRQLNTVELTVHEENFHDFAHRYKCAKKQTEPLDITCNHPFIFVVFHKKYGYPLYIGHFTGTYIGEDVQKLFIKFFKIYKNHQMAMSQSPVKSQISDSSSNKSKGKYPERSKPKSTISLTSSKKSTLSTISSHTKHKSKRNAPSPKVSEYPKPSQKYMTEFVGSKKSIKNLSHTKEQNDYLSRQINDMEKNLKNSWNKEWKDYNKRNL
ncbi:hypothetical protein SNEBB_004987 [Seison nebaliae]|nr:hypothetical protein SNEBB_004987 [Seison nebaliae]